MHKRAGFTLIELTVAVGIIALLVAVLLPSLSRAKHMTQATRCLSNLRQLVVAAHMYAHSSSNRFPIAYYRVTRRPITTLHEWDFRIIRNITTGQTWYQPGHLWQAKTNVEVQQCPTFLGASNSADVPYTGYNYNTSYVGHGTSESTVSPVRITEVIRPTECALFGDGEHGDGANKFMRAPIPEPGVDDLSISFRHSGSQGFRHLANTNVGFADGHAAAWRYRYEAGVPYVAPGTGFLTPDNRLYDLK